MYSTHFVFLLHNDSNVFFVVVALFCFTQKATTPRISVIPQMVAHASLGKDMQICVIARAETEESL